MSQGVITREQVQATQQAYLAQIVKRNKQEKDFFRSFVEDYCAVIKELKDNKDWLVQQKAENEQLKTMKGDPIALKKAREEIAFLKSQNSRDDLKDVTDRLQLTEAKAQISQENRELTREKNALQKRLMEVEEVLIEKGNVLQSAQKQLEQTVTQFDGMRSALTIAEDKVKRLTSDNQEYVKQLIAMKESHAQLVNDCLAGKVNQQNSQSFQSNMNAEESKLSQIIKPEYLRPMIEQTELPSSVVWRCCAHQIETTSLALNRDGSIVYTGGGDGIVYAWEAASGRKLSTMSGLNQTVLDVSASLDDKHVAATSIASNSIQLFRTKTTTRIEQYAGHTNLVTSVRFNYNQKSLISASNDKTIRTWDISTGQHTVAQCPVPIQNIDLSWSETIMASTHRKDLMFWNTTKGTAELIHRLPNAHLDLVTCARFTADERHVVTTGYDHVVKIWDVRTWKQVYSPGFEEELYTCPNGVAKTKLAVSPDSQFAVVGSQNGAVIVLNIKTGSQIEIAEIYDDEHSSAVTSVEWVPGKSAFATIDTSGILAYWKA